MFSVKGDFCFRGLCTICGDYVCRIRQTFFRERRVCAVKREYVCCEGGYVL